MLSKNTADFLSILQNFGGIVGRKNIF